MANGIIQREQNFDYLQPAGDDEFLDVCVELAYGLKDGKYCGIYE